jgi:hypothetical protein
MRQTTCDRVLAAMDMGHDFFAEIKNERISSQASESSRLG